MSAREKGTVKWFNSDKGYGFIARDGSDIFVHYKDVQMEGFVSLHENQVVEFEVGQSPKGDKAVNVTVVEE